MKQSELEHLCNQTGLLVEVVAGFIRNEVGKVEAGQIEVKSLNSLVSYVDKTAEEKLVAGLQKILPGSVFLTEEATIAAESGEFQWIIDPLDGTTNFLHQLPCFAVSVALRHEEKMVVGIVHEVNHNESFYAWKGGGAFLNGKPIRVSPTTRLADSLIATGFPYRDYDKIKPYFVALEELMKRTRGLRRFGSAATDLAYVACGRFDAFFEYSLSPWDVAAGILLVQEAGGKVTDFGGGEDFLFGGEMLAASGGVFEEMLAQVRAAFKKDAD